MIRKLPLTLRVVVAYFICFGLLSGAAGIIQFGTPSAVSQVKPRAIVSAVETPQEAPDDVPRRIWLPRLKIDLAVNDGYYDKATKEWTLTDDAAQYATVTAKLSDKPGNTLIYGHNTPKVLEPTKNLKVGDLLEITSADNRVYSYLYKSDRNVVPSDTSIFYESYEKPQVSLMTCNGIGDEYRRIMKFELMSVR